MGLNLKFDFSGQRINWRFKLQLGEYYDRYINQE